jgi:hypothetical protein
MRGWTYVQFGSG